MNRLLPRTPSRSLTLALGVFSLLLVAAGFAFSPAAKRLNVSQFLLITFW